MAGEGRLEPRDPASAEHHEGPEHTSPGPSPHLGGQPNGMDTRPTLQRMRGPLHLPAPHVALLLPRLPQSRTPGPGTVRKLETRTSRESGRAGSWRRYSPQKQPVTRGFGPPCPAFDRQALSDRAPAQAYPPGGYQSRRAPSTAGQPGNGCTMSARSCATCQVASPARVCVASLRPRRTIRLRRVAGSVVTR